MALDGVTGAKSKPANLRRRNVDVVRAGQVVGIRRSQEAEAVRENLDNAFADNIGFLNREFEEPGDEPGPTMRWQSFRTAKPRSVVSGIRAATRMQALPALP